MMPLARFIEKHYQAARKAQSGIECDPDMLQMLSGSRFDAPTVTRWMDAYNLFRNLTTEQRAKAVGAFKKYRDNARRKGLLDGRRLTRDEVQERFEELYLHLYRENPRNWISGTSKLLWCLHPKDIVIYDSFVNRALTVLQHIDPALAHLERLSSPKSPASEDDVKGWVAHYMHAYDMVQALRKAYRAQLTEQRKLHAKAIPYEWEIRVMDGLLMSLGNPRAQRAERAAPAAE